MRPERHEKNEKAVCGDRSLYPKNLLQVGFDGLPTLARQKKIKSNRTLRPKGRSGFDFCRFRRFRVAGREKIIILLASCAATPRFHRFSKRTQRLARYSFRVRARESWARLLAQRFSKRIRLRLYGALCIVELTFRGLPRPISCKVQICTLIVDELRRVATSWLIACSLNWRFGL
jgi:hypothetical protein